MTSKMLYTRQSYIAERELAAMLNTINKIPCEKLPWESYIEGLLDEQPQAVKLAAEYRISLLYGVPGAGKTTTIKKVIQCLDGSGMKGLLLTPTNKARRRAKEVLDTISDKLNNVPDCMTTWKALGYSPKTGLFTFNESNTIDFDYIVVDEASFLGSVHARDLMLAIDPKRTRVIFSGDPYQLPSVEPGCVYRDMITSMVFPYTNLRVSRRQGKNSGIVYNAGLVLRGENPISVDPRTGEKFADWFFVEKQKEECQKTILNWITNSLPKRGFDPFKDVQILSPGKRCEAGVDELNRLVKSALNPGTEFRVFKKGDKVVSRINDRATNVCNGDTGLVLECSSSGMTVDLGEGAGPDETGIVDITGDIADKFYLNYAGTVHGSQGSEYRVQITPLYRQHYMLLSRNMFYTAMTRAKELSLNLGEPDALIRSVNFSQTNERVTGLTEMLK